MTSDLQIMANRRNSQKSTGPRTPAGKLTSSQNACKTGIYSTAEIIRDENAADLDALTADYHARFHPDGPEESCLIDILVHSEWMLRRLRRAEAQLWEKYIDDSESTYRENEYDLGRALCVSDSQVFSRLQRRIDATQRNYQRALKDLQQLQSAKPATHSVVAQDGPQPAQAVSPAPVPTAPPIGFVPPPAARRTTDIFPTSRIL